MVSMMNEDPQGWESQAATRECQPNCLFLSAYTLVRFLLFMNGRCSNDTISNFRISEDLPFPRPITPLL